ncbi:MFS transporter [Pusillimonas noertemannii]|uniref:Sugar phosphate permease n=1 Tax=Pusillimonas noertemannii TaxID=305977 RepID=A0A2U1CSX8_9BURK|nr:MFS transporter [Pusillimonas noertemannii]NYT70510.1 MFS transporter [Pusillimonas noertemannii]PVY68979.1 sugar phosphate permease [Pusillimonas noertemannii]TFL11580.1 MFS transporter [Pusillimonas noertemannii]
MVATTFDQFADTPAIKRRDWKIIGLIGAGHSCSHFFQLVFPTLFLPLAAEFGFDFVQLGLLASMFFVVSSLGQASSGFVVDRIGPTPVLRFGLACFVVSGVLIGLSTNYAMLMLAAIIGGAGNSVFHPVDFSIINHRVSSRRLGHAFSTHGFTGNLGWALTPVFMTTLIHLGDWRLAAFGAAGLVAAVLFLIWIGRDLLAGRNEERPAAKPKAGETPDLAQQSVGRTLATLLVQPALWGAFFFFACTSIALSAVQNFTIPMLGDVYGIDKVMAGTTLSGYMLASALGMIAGGFLVNATPNTERTVALSLIAAGALLVLLASGVLISPLAMIVVGLAGFCAGVSTPSRDMLIRRVTPKGATGTVYGLVYSGMDVGASLGPVGFGLMLDAGHTQGPWIGAAIAFVAASGLAMMVARSVNARTSPQAVAG